MDDTRENESLSLIRTITLVIGAHIIMMLTDGATLSFGIFLTDFADTLSVGLGVIGAASSSLSFVADIFGPFGVYLATKTGYRISIVIGTLMTAVGLMLSSQVRETWQLFLSHSLFTGIGVALAYTNVVAYIGITCDKHISMANGVSQAGTATGWITIPLLINLLRGMYGWRGALLLLGAVALHATVLSLILFRSTRKEPQSKICKHSLDKDSMELHCEDVEDNDDTDSQTKKTKVELLKEYFRLPVTYPLFGFLIIVANLISLAFIGTLFHLVPSAIKRGIPETKAALLLTVYGIGSIIGRILQGVPIELKLIKTRNIFVIAIIVAGLSTFLLPFCRNYQSIVSATFFIGVSTGACIPLIYLDTREIVGIQNFSKALGIMLFTTAFINVVAGFFTGWIYDVSGSYNTAFFIMGSIYFVGCFVMVVPGVYLKYKKEKTNSKHTVTVNSSEVISLSSPESLGTEL